MRKASSTTSLAYSLATIFAIPASTSIRLPVSFEPGGLDHHRVGDLDLGGHLREPEQHRLVLGDRLAEGLALLGVGDGELEPTPRQPARAGGDVDPADLDAVHHLEEPLAGLPAEHLLGGDLVALEDQLGRLDALVAHLVDLARHGDPLGGLTEPGLLLHQERRHVLVHRLVALVGLGQHRDQGGGGAVGQPHLLPRDASTTRRRPSWPWSTTAETSEPRPGSDMRERAPHLTGRHPREVLLLLLRRAVLQEHVGHDEVGVDHPRHAHPPAGDLLDHQRVRQQRLAEPAELLGDRQPEHAELLEPLDDLGRVLVGVLELLGHRDDLLVHELPDGLQDLGLVLGEAIGLAEAGHVVAPGRSRLDRSESSYRSFTLGRSPRRDSRHTAERAWPA